MWILKKKKLCEREDMEMTVVVVGDEGKSDINWQDVGGKGDSQA